MTLAVFTATRVEVALSEFAGAASGRGGMAIRLPPETRSYIPYSSAAAHTRTNKTLTKVDKVFQARRAPYTSKALISAVA